MINSKSNELELIVLKSFFDQVKSIVALNSSISDYPMVRETQNKLKIALRNADHRCSCAKRRYGICEICQASPGQLCILRNFYRVIKKAKKHNWSSEMLEEFIKNTGNSL